MSGFTKEQLAMAKQLQASFGSKGSQPNRSAPVQKAARTSVPPPTVRPPPTSRPVQSQPASAISSSNGLVRPLPSKAPATSPVTSSKASVRPVNNVVPVQPPPKAAPKPAPKQVLVQAPAQPTIKAASKQVPFQPATQSKSKPTPPPPAPVPEKKLASQPVSVSAPPVQAPPKPAPIDLMSMEPLAVISIPTLVAQPASRGPEVKMGVCDTSPQVQQMADAAPEPEMGQGTGKVTDLSEEVRRVIKINKMGKCVIWNYMTEAPAIRELSAGELEEMKPLPPPDNARWVRPWHVNPPPAIGSNEQAAQGSPTQRTPRPVIGLKGSRHAC